MPADLSPLIHLVADLMTVDQMRTLILDLPRWETLQIHLPEGPTSRATQAAELVRILREHGAIDEALRAELVRRYPNRAADIERAVARASRAPTLLKRPPPSHPTRSTVLTLHADAARAADHLELGQDVRRLHIACPRGAWARERVCWSDWERTRAALLELVPEQVDGDDHLHVLMRGPYALGLLLGRLLEDRIHLHLYQYSASTDGSRPERWEDWGPEGLEGGSPDPFFYDLDGLEAVGAASAHVAMVIQTVRVDSAVSAALGSLGLPEDTPLCRLSARALGHAQVSQENVGRAESEIWRAWAALRDRAPRATIHLFLRIPLALGVRAGRKLHHAGRLIAYEYMYTEDGPAYVPVLAFPAGTPRWPPLCPNAPTG